VPLRGTRTSGAWKPAEVAPPPRQPAGCAQQHVVARGNTLHALARQYSTTVAALVDLNHIADRI